MSTAETLPPSKSSLRDKVKDRLSLSGTSFRIPRFLTNEPASPARYKGKPISPAYNLSSRESGKEQWYFPPEPPKQTLQRPKVQSTVKRVPRSRDSAPAISPLYPSPETELSMQHTQTPRAVSLSTEYFPFPTAYSGDSPFRKLVVQDFRNEKRILYADVEIHSGMLYDLIQSIPAVWLQTPVIKEAFIPLLRSDGLTVKEKSPTPNELRLIDGFLLHLPDVHIISAKRIPRKRPSTMEYKRNLSLSTELVDEFEKHHPRTHVLYSYLIIATILHEISLWIIQQLLHSGSEVLCSEMVPQHEIFGGILMVETHPEEDPQLAFVDRHGEAWMISMGWLLFKYAEGPEGLPFLSERSFQRRRCGVVKKVGGMNGGLESFD